MAEGSSDGIRQVFRFFVALFYILVIFPIYVVVEIFRWILALVRSSPWLFFLLGISLLTIPVAAYHDRINIYVEYFMRCYVEPVWTDILEPIWLLIEIPYNLLICWWNAINWASFGYFNDFLIPTILHCGLKNIFLKVVPVVQIFMEEFVAGYFASGAFLTGFYDNTNFGLACIDLLDAWIELWCCLCMDLCVFFRCSPIPILFIVYPWFQWSGYLTHLDFYLAAGDTVNVVAAVIQLIVRLLIQIFTLGLVGIDPRPDIEVAAGQFCLFGFHFMRATELVLQCYWDAFVPFKFNFVNFLCLLDTLNCIVMDSLVVLFRVFIHVDLVVFDLFTPNPATGVGPRPGSIWHSSIRALIVRILNTWAPVTDPNFFIEVAPLGRTRMTECILSLIHI